MRASILGGSGFVGSHVARRVRADGHDAGIVRAPRMQSSVQDAVGAIADAERWISGNRELFASLVRQMEGADVVLNCAGLASPGSDDSAALTGANAVLPVVGARAAERAGASTYVHVSSAAVQGRKPYLDESDAFWSVSPYATSKALGERSLHGVTSSLRIYVYRATSVQSPERGMTQALLRYCALPRVPIWGDGQQPLPLSLAENTAAAIVHLASTTPSTGTYLHPWESMTVKRMVELLSPPASRPLRLPTSLATPGLGALFRLGSRSSRVLAVATRLDLLVSGQTPAGTKLSRTGFQPPVGDEGYERLRNPLPYGRTTP